MGYGRCCVGADIVEFQPADLPALREMMAVYLTEFYPGSDPGSHWSEEYYARLCAGVARGTHTIWLAKMDARPLGFVLARIEQHWYGELARSGLIEECYVAPEGRRQGIGSALAMQVVAAYRARGIGAIGIQVVQANLSALLFWQRLGFKIEAYHLFLQE